MPLGIGARSTAPLASARTTVGMSSGRALSNATQATGPTKPPFGSRYLSLENLQHVVPSAGARHEADSGHRLGIDDSVISRCVP